ncbi:MAG: hypothetical protein QOD99_1567 [Chthoniobacter sp.]|jgi:colanic acid/amylovoran biosynthesis glycosyltransferase|nr:hypothetical protein [Chthoniobacter sp.]
MLHIYRQIMAMETFRPVVIAQKRENILQFPFDDVVVLRKSRIREVRRFWAKKIRRQPLQISGREAARIVAELRRCRARLLHIYFGHIGVHLLPLLQLEPLPVIVSFHGADAMVDMDKPAFRAAMQAMLARVRLLLVRSHSLGDRLVDLGCAREKIRLHRTGIPIKELSFVQREVPSDGAWKIVQACRLIPKKGLQTSLRAFTKFAHAFPAATFTISGEGPLLADLQASATELGLLEKVRFTGFLPQRALRELLYEAHFFLHPSELGTDGNQEGVPNSMLEAMATGLPVLATTHGGIPEAVEHSVSGLLVHERDDEALARAILDLANDPLRFQAMSAAASHAVAEKFELHAQVRALEGFYREAIT